MCKSEYTATVSLEGTPWWVCNHQGCSGRVSGAKFYWHPGQGLPPKAKKSKATKEEPKEEGRESTEEEAEEASA